MDVLKFINSSALREHLKKIDYKFNGLEAAWLVYNSRDTSLDDKLSAWQEIIDTYPDELFRTWRGTKRNKPIYEEEPPMLHDYLRHYINMKKRELDFITSDTHTTLVYFFRVLNSFSGEP